MALMLIAIIAVGLTMTFTENHSLYPLHKSFGLLAFLFILFRLYWRKKSPWPSISQKTEQEKLVRFVHSTLLIFMILMPVSGMFYSGFLGYGVSLFGLEIVPRNLNSESQVIPYQATLGNSAKLLHGLLGYAFSILIILHISAALKHHFIDKDETLKRMIAQKTT